MNFWEFASSSPWTAFFLACIVIWGIDIVWATPFRAMNIRKHGWPPAHCDADGDSTEKD